MVSDPGTAAGHGQAADQLPAVFPRKLEYLLTRRAVQGGRAAPNPASVFAAHRQWWRVPSTANMRWGASAPTCRCMIYTTTTLTNTDRDPAIAWDEKIWHGENSDSGLRVEIWGA